MVQATVETLAVGQTGWRDDTIAGRAVAARRPRVQGAVRWPCVQGFCGAAPASSPGGDGAGSGTGGPPQTEG